MSRIIIERHPEVVEGEEWGDPRLVIGWDQPLATYFWQVMGSGDEAGIALKSRGDWPNDLPTWASFMDSLSEEFKNKFSEKGMRRILEKHQGSPDSGSIIIDTTEWPGWICEVIADGSGVWANNAIVTSTKEEAEAYAKNLEARWFLVREWRVVRTTESPNYKINLDNGEMLEAIR